MNDDKTDADQYRKALEEIRNVSESYDRRPQSKLIKSSPFWRGKLEGLRICAKIARTVLTKLKKESQ